jgi:hypothetical protein
MVWVHLKTQLEARMADGVHNAALHTDAHGKLFWIACCLHAEGCNGVQQSIKQLPHGVATENCALILN